METKKCSKCNETRNINLFGKIKGVPRYDCNLCRKAYREANKEHIREKQKEFYNKNKNELIIKNKEYRDANKEKINEQRKEYRNRDDVKEHIKAKNKEYLPIRKEKIKQRRLTDNNFRISEALRSKFHKFIKGQKTSISNYLGCDLNFYTKWIESNFTNEMSWDNYGKEWDMDHVIPTSILDFSNEKNIKFCYNWINFRPLKKSDNMSKSNKLYNNYILNQINDVKKYIKNNTNYEYQSLEEMQDWLRENTQVW